MARKSKETNVEPSIFRAMIEKFPYKHISVDFTSKEEALEYVHTLTSESTTWYGLYEINPRIDRLIYIEHRRLRPYDDPPKDISKDNTRQTSVKRRRSK
jgi:hypothetical protein